MNLNKIDKWMIMLKTEVGQETTSTEQNQTQKHQMFEQTEDISPSYKVTSWLTE